MPHAALPLGRFSWQPAATCLVLLSCLQVLEALAVTKPAVAAAEVRKVQERFRARHYCDRVLAACSTADAAT